MISPEISSKQACEKAEEIAQQLKEDFGNVAARKHLTECVNCLNALADKPPSAGTDWENVLTLVSNIRNGIACSG